MPISNILIVSPANYNHNQAFYDIAYSFHQAIPGSIVTTDPSECHTGTTLIFGSHLLPKFGGKIIGEDVILYQTEQLGAGDSLFESPEYLDLLKQYAVWDYSSLNVAYLKAHGIDARLVPVGYSPSLSNLRTGRSIANTGGGKNGRPRLDFAEWSGAYPQTASDGSFVEDIDICFYGSANERRLDIINGLKAKTLTSVYPDGTPFERPLVVASFGGYGGFRDKLIARSKIILNIHFYDAAIFEIFRCSHLFANRKCVVSERGKDHNLESPYYDHATFVDYDLITDRCMELLLDTEARIAAANHCYNVFRSTTQAAILKEHLA